MRNRAVIIPNIESRRRSEGAGQHLRRRDGSHRRRRVQHRRQFRFERVARQRARCRTVPSGGPGKFFFAQQRPPETGQLLLAVRRRRRRARSSRTARSSGRRPRATSTKTSRSAVLDPANRARAARRLLTERRDRLRSVDHDVRSGGRLHATAIREQPHSGRPDQPGRQSRHDVSAVADVGQLAAGDRGADRSRPTRRPSSSITASNEQLNISGMYAWYDSEEPESRFYGKTLGENPGDPGEGLLLRTVHAAIVNSLWMPNQTTVWNFRYGFTQFIDDDVPNAFDPATLNFAPSYLALIPYQKFPSLNVQGYGSVEFRHAWRPVPAGHDVLLAQPEREHVPVLRESYDQARRRVSGDRDEIDGVRPAERQSSTSLRPSRAGPIPSPAARPPTRSPASCSAFRPMATSRSARRTTSTFGTSAGTCRTTTA